MLTIRNNLQTQKLEVTAQTDYCNMLRRLHEAAKVAEIPLGWARDTFADNCSNNMRMSDESLAGTLGHTSTNYVKKYKRINIHHIAQE